MNGGDILIDIKKANIYSLLKKLDPAQYYAHTEPIFKKLSILPLVKLHKFVVIIFMFKFRNNMLSEIFNEMFEQNINVHSYHTRQRNKLHVPKYRLNITLKHIWVLFYGMLF